MSTRLLIIADTHIPVRAKDLPAEVWRHVSEADVVVHAGDWMDAEFADTLHTASARLIGVYGNNDGPAIRARFPEFASAELDGVTIGVVHETGQTTGREVRCDRQFPGLDVLVFGHSHIPWDSVTPNGMRLLNPGSPTDRRRQPDHTYLTARTSEGTLREVRLHRIPPRTRR